MNVPRDIKIDVLNKTSITAGWCDLDDVLDVVLDF